MDGDIIGLLALLVFWLLGQWSRKKQKRAAELPSDPQTTEDPDLDDALAEIRRALGMETPKVPAPMASEAPAVAEREKASDEFHRVETGRPDYEARFEQRRPFDEASSSLEERFERRRPFSEVKSRLEDQFESMPAFDEPFVSTEDSFERMEDLFGDPLIGHDHVDIVEEEILPESPVLRDKRLRTRAALREAFVLKEIVGPPRVFKKDIRH